jgi:hypothetical protein
MPRAVRTLIALSAAVAIATSVAACGGGSASDVVAEVGHTTITKAELNHWMPTLLGGDMYELTDISSPKTVVSEPSNFTVCVRSLKTVAPDLTTAELTTRCHQLNQLLRVQAVEYLINSDVLIGQAAEVGATVSNREIATAFNELKGRAFPTDAALQLYLQQRDWSLSTELFIIKRNLLGTKLLQKVSAKLGKKPSEEAIDRYYKTLNNRWLAKTTCRPGYIVEGCRQYKKPKTPAKTSPAIVIEETLTAGR